MTRPGQRLVGLHDRNLRARPASRHHQVRHRDGRVGGSLRHQEGAQPGRACDGRRQADRQQSGRQAAQPRQAKRQQVPPLRRDERVQLVEHHRLQVAKQVRRVVVAEQQSDLLGRRQQDVGRSRTLAGALGHGGVAGPRLDANRQTHLGDRGGQVACDVDRQRLQRRDVQRVQTRALRRLPATRGQVDEARQEARKRLAGAGRSDQQRRASLPGVFDQRDLMRAGRPAATGEPGLERGRQSRRRRLLPLPLHARRHAGLQSPRIANYGTAGASTMPMCRGPKARSMKSWTASEFLAAIPSASSFDW